MAASENPAAGSADDGGNNNGIITIKDIYNLLKREVETPALQEIDHDIYQRVAASLGNLKGQGFEGVEARLRDRMVELLSDAARLLIEVRQRKLAVVAVAAAAAPSSAAGGGGGEPIDYSKLTDEEKYILDSKTESASRLEQVVLATSRGRPKVLEAISAKIRSKQIVVRFVRPMEQFIGVDMTKYGPFQPEDVATLPLENARSFIDGGIAVQVHAQI
jgi:DNA replication factor GINS